jgi:superfamily I DNA/RNA helicase
LLIDFCLIFVPFGHCDEPEILSYENPSVGPKGADVRQNVATTSGHVSVATMHLAKGLEFRAVVVMACDDEIIPLQERIETVGDDADLLEVYNTERHLLYVACTRARDYLLVTGVDPVSEFLDDLIEGDKGYASRG